MKLPHNLRSWMILGALALTVAPVSARPAPDTPAGMPVFGSVDINKIQGQSARKARYDAELHTLADRLDTAFKLQAASVMLSKAEQTELGTLLGKPNPSDPDRAHITALQTQATNAAHELADLQQKKDPSPADTSRMTTLTTQYETGKAALQEIGDQYQAQLKTLSDKDNTEFTVSVREAIASVAQQKGLSVVFTSDIAVYTANDITDDVVKRINK